MLNLKINRTKPVQENFLGNNAVYHGYAGMPDFKNRVYTEEQCELEADRLKHLGIRVVRTYTKWWAWSREEGWNWENETITAFYNWCRRMQVRDIDIAIHGGWCSPGDINGTCWGGEGPFADGGVDFETATENFAAYVSEMLHQLIEVRGFTNIKYLMLFTESERFSGKAEGFSSPYEVWEYISRRIHNRLVKDGRRNLVKLIGPNENARSIDCFPYALKYARDNAADFLDYYGCHIYARHCIENMDEVHSGKRSVFYNAPGQRIQQKVTLKSGCEYTLSCCARVSCEDVKSLSGYLLLGFFDAYDDPKIKFESGGSDTTRLTVDSTKLFEPTDCGNKWHKLELKYTAKSDTDALVGFFVDIKNKNVVVYTDDFSLTENGSENLIKNPSFENEDSSWQGVFSTPVAYDIYNDWQLWVKQMRNVIGEENGLWYDEYNCAHEHYKRFVDPAHGTRLAMGNIALMNAGVTNFFIWTAFDQQWPNSTTTNEDSFKDGVQSWGLMPVLTESLVPYPKYYAYGLVSRYAGGGEGTKVFAEEGYEERLHCTLTESPNGEISLIVVNAKKEEANFCADLGGDNKKILNRHLFDPATVKPDENARIAGIDKSIMIEDNKINDTIPAGAVAVYTTRLD